MSVGTGDDPVIFADTICVLGDTVYVEGGSTIQNKDMVAVFGKVFVQGMNRPQANPWDDSASNPPSQGTIGSGNQWHFDAIRIPGGTALTLRVWAIYENDGCFATDVTEFRLEGDLGGSGSIIGSCSGSQGMSDRTRRAGEAMFKAAPRYYKLDQGGHDSCNEGTTGDLNNLLLKHDETTSDEVEAKWRCVAPPAGISKLELRVIRQGQERLGLLELKLEDGACQTWHITNWDFTARNQLEAGPQNTPDSTSPLSIEPA